MILDAHQHFWKYDPDTFGWINDSMRVLRRDFMPEDLGPLLAAEGIAGCVAVQAMQTDAETTFLLDLANQNSWIKAVIGWVDLLADDLDEQLEWLGKFQRLKGFRHIIQDEPDEQFMLRPDFVRGMQALGAHDFSYDLLVYEHQLPMVPLLLDQCPDQRFVLDHLGKPIIGPKPSDRWIESIYAIADHPHTCCKLSGLVTEADWRNWKPADFQPFLEIALDAFGPERLMWGSDWPVCLLAVKAYPEVYHVLDNFLKTRPESEQTAIMGGNAARFYQIN